jgi:hypothetical protein
MKRTQKSLVEAKAISEALCRGCDFAVDQIEEITSAVYHGLTPAEIALFAKPHFSRRKMRIIWQCIKENEGVDVSLLLDARLSEEQMKVIAEAISADVDLSDCASHVLPPEKLRLILESRIQKDLQALVKSKVNSLFYNLKHKRPALFVNECVYINVDASPSKDGRLELNLFAEKRAYRDKTVVLRLQDFVGSECFSERSRSLASLCGYEDAFAFVCDVLRSLYIERDDILMRQMSPQDADRIESEFKEVIGDYLASVQRKTVHEIMKLLRT